MVTIILMLDGLRFAMLETGNEVYIELVEMKLPMQPVGDSEVFWHLALRTAHLEKSLDAAINAGFEVTIPIWPLRLLNNVTSSPGRCAWLSSAALMAAGG